MKESLPQIVEYITEDKMYCLVLYKKLLTNISLVPLNSDAIDRYRSRWTPATDFSHQVYTNKKYYSYNC